MKLTAAQHRVLNVLADGANSAMGISIRLGYGRRGTGSITMALRRLSMQRLIARTSWTNYRLLVAGRRLVLKERWG